MKHKNPSYLMGRLLSIQTRNEKKGNRVVRERAAMIEGFGLEGDVYGGAGPRQVSLLSVESIRKQPNCPKFKKRGDQPGPGDFSENLTTEGLILSGLETGDTLAIGRGAVIRITEKGRICHRTCALYEKEGGCPIPGESVFGEVMRGGGIAAGDGIEVTRKP